MELLRKKNLLNKNHIDKANGNKKTLYCELLSEVIFVRVIYYGFIYSDPTLIYYFIINSNGIYINKNDKIIYLISNLVAVILSIVINLTYTKTILQN